MRSVNEVTLLGNLTRDPLLRTTEQGQPVCTFSVATNREWKTQTGEKRSLPEFHNIVAWSKLAEKCHTFLSKGKLVFLKGYLKTRAFDTPHDGKSYRTEIVIYDMIMLDKRTLGDSAYDEDLDSATHHSALEVAMQAEDEAGEITNSFEDTLDTIDNI